jgi:hypothetical protein
MKRDRAKAALDQIVKRFGVISNEAEPGLEVLLDCLTNMVYALELLMKVMESTRHAKVNKSMPNCGRCLTHRLRERLPCQPWNRPAVLPELPA